MVRTLVRYGYAPVFFAGFIGMALYAIGNGAPVWTLTPLLVLAVAISFAAERLAPYESAWNHDMEDDATNLIHALVNEGSIILSVLALPVISAMTPSLAIWPVTWPLWAQLVLAIVIGDLGITLAHFASHRTTALWRLHSVHHSARRLYGFNGLMKHPLHQAVELVAGVTPLLIMGMTSTVAWLLSFAVAIQLLLQHSNVDMRIGPLAYLWAVAPAHRHHHIASAVDGDVNFGLFLSIWDHALGTFEINRAMPRDGEVGVAGRPDFPKRYLEQLAEPFRHQKGY